MHCKLGVALPTKGVRTPMTRQSKFLWMKDLLEHMHRCHEEWQGADERRERLLAESLRRDLDEFRRLCDSLQRENDARLNPTSSPYRVREMAA